MCACYASNDLRDDDGRDVFLHNGKRIRMPLHRVASRVSPDGGDEAIPKRSTSPC